MTDGDQGIVAKLGISGNIEVNGFVTQLRQLFKFLCDSCKQHAPSHKGVDRQLPVIK